MIKHFNLTNHILNFYQIYSILIDYDHIHNDIKITDYFFHNENTYDREH